MTYLKNLQSSRERAVELEKKRTDERLENAGQAAPVDPAAVGAQADVWKPKASVRARGIAARLEANHPPLEAPVVRAPVAPETVMSTSTTLRNLGAPTSMLNRYPRLRESGEALNAIDQARKVALETAVEPLKTRLGSLTPELLLALKGAQAAVKDEHEYQGSLRAIEKVVADAPNVDERHIEAFVAAAKAASKSERQELGSALQQSWATIKAAEPSRALTAADAVERSSVGGTDVPVALQVALKSLDTQVPAKQLVDEVGRTWRDGQRTALTEGIERLRQRWSNEPQRLANAAALKQQVPLELHPLFDRATALLSSEALSTFASIVAQPAEPAVRAARAEVALPLLRDGATADIVTNALGAVDRVSRFDPTLASRAAQLYRPEQLAGIFSGTASVLEKVPANLLAQATPADLHALSDGIAATRGAFANGEGPISILAPALQQVQSARELSNLLSTGPLITHALHTMEDGAVKTSLTQGFAANLKTLSDAGVDLGTVAAAYPNVAPEVLPTLLVAGLKRGNAIAPVAAADPVFKGGGTRKDAVRSVRSAIALIEESGGDSTAFLTALKGSPVKPKEYQDVAKAMMSEAPPTVTAAQTNEAITLLQQGVNPSTVIRPRMQAAMVAKLNLNAILQDANVKVTDRGYQALFGSLSQTMSEFDRNGNMTKDQLKSLVTSVLEDKYQDLKFELPPAAHQLKSLNEAQTKGWKNPETMVHVRFQGDGQARFDERVSRAAGIGQLLLGRMEKQWGPLAELEARHGGIVEKLRALPKDDVAGRKAALAELGDLPNHLELMKQAQTLATTRPEATTPLQFEQLGEKLKGLEQFGNLDAATELRFLFRIDDLPYTEVVTNDGASLADIDRLIVRGGSCIRGASLDAAAYMLDANKRVIITRNQAGEERRAVMRLVERQDPGHEGQPMLVLERSYPDNQNPEEKLRLIEHAVRRAAELHMAVGFPTEYYWDGSKTARRIADMNEQINDLNRRYQMTSREAQMKVTNTAGNSRQEYVDSAPKTIAQRGVVGPRHYPGNQDTVYENIFMLLEPK